LDKRIFVEKREQYRQEASQLMDKLNAEYGLGLEDLHVYVIYDIYGIDSATYEQAKSSVFSEVMIDQVYDVEWTKKGSNHYLVYQSEEQEKVVLKFNEDKLTMTRFSEPKSIMRFISQGQALVGIHTPVGLQQFVTDTSFYKVDFTQQVLQLHYQLKTVDGEQIFASYEMEISWG